MTLRVTSLASGSSGNALVIQAGGAALLVDCGLPQRAIERHLRHADLSPADLAAIVLTHEHGDHTLSAGPLARRHRVPLVANQLTAAALGPALAGVDLRELAVGGLDDGRLRRGRHLQNRVVVGRRWGHGGYYSTVGSNATSPPFNRATWLRAQAGSSAG